MKSNFEITTQSIKAKWLFWEDISAASVLLEITPEADQETAAEVLRVLIEGVEKSLSMGCHRAFIFFKEEHFDVARFLLSHFSNNNNGFEMNVEIIEEQKKAPLYDYCGLADFIDQTSPKKMAILSLAPDREKQAKRLGVYL